jgi:hypothetical protein
MTSQPAFWITVVLLAPFWWGIGILLLALLGLAAPSLRASLNGLFARLEATEIPR